MRPRPYIPKKRSYESGKERNAVQMMVVGASKSLCRWRLQTTLRCCNQNLWNPTIRKAFGMSYKWTIEWFSKIGLKSANWYYYHIMYRYTIEQYVERQQSKNK